MAGGAGAYRAQAPPGHGNTPSHQPSSGGYDGPGEPSSGRPSGYTGPSSPSQGPLSPHVLMSPGSGPHPPTGPPSSAPFGPLSPGRPFGDVAPLGYDPARPKPQQANAITNTRVELPAAAYSLGRQFSYNFPSALPNRPSYNTAGKEVKIRVNQYKVLSLPTQDVYQYDIMFGNGAEKRGKVMALWKSKAVQNTLDRVQKSMNIAGPWLWDGNKLAWFNWKIPNQSIEVILDQEKGRQPKAGQVFEKCFVQIRCTKSLRMAAIAGYMSKQIPFDASILECITFLDHLMRQGPSRNYTMIKRSFFSRGVAGNASQKLDEVVFAMKGVYSSIRLCHPGTNPNAPLGTGLAVNVDVANGTFWSSQPVHQAARNLCNNFRGGDWPTFQRLLEPVQKTNGKWQKSEEFELLKRIQKLKFKCPHMGQVDSLKEHTIKHFSFSERPGGENADTWHFDWKNPKNNHQVEHISVFNYYLKKWNKRLQFPKLPLIRTERDGCIPMELAVLSPNQRYNYKMSPDQTAAMIKFAVTRPKERIQSILHGIDMLKWSNDPYLNFFNLKIDQNMTQTQARLLQNPEVQFTGSKINPGTTGRWDLRGKKFLQPNPQPLASWCFIIVGGACDEATVRNFANVFINTYNSHGGKVSNKQPLIYEQKRNEELSDTIAIARRLAGNQANSQPQILMFIMPGRDSHLYERIKKNAECRWAMVSQCLNVAHVRKASPQYCSNVCMKVNAKLGGTTSKVASAKPFFAVPTLIIGADVSHPSVGSPQASMAAITMSMDSNACRFVAAVETNGYRVEMISPNNWNTLLIPMMDQWIQTVGGNRGPAHIYYFRDGVSEGQYSHVLDQELSDMKKAIASKYGQAALTGVKFTVTICTKRHHIRFFPNDKDYAAGDKNGNPHPGTLVEKDVTHPFEYDFYLNSHSAIQGTARPVHYHVILDEANVPPNEFQKMIYQFSYQYMRSTTPVSLFPAVYYAHLASNRGRSHESIAFSEGPRGGQKGAEKREDAAVAAGAGAPPRSMLQSTTGSSHPDPDRESIPLLPMGSVDSPDQMRMIRGSMWYI